MSLTLLPVTALRALPVRAKARESSGVATVNERREETRGISRLGSVKIGRLTAEFTPVYKWTFVTVTQNEKIDDGNFPFTLDFTFTCLLLRRVILLFSVLSLS